MIDYPKEVKIFIEKTKAECEHAGFEYILSPDANVLMEGGKWSGTFDCSIKKLIVSTGGKEWQRWFRTLVHEYCHFTQFQDNNQVWKNMRGNKFLEWANNRTELEPSQLYSDFKDVQRLELDCEIRAIQMIEDNNLPVDTDEYKTLINLHMYLYTMMRETRQIFKVSPYSVPELKDYVTKGTLLSIAEYDKPCKELKNMILEKCFK
jgi:hypothetical protein